MTSTFLLRGLIERESFEIQWERQTICESLKSLLFSCLFPPVTVTCLLLLTGWVNVCSWILRRANLSFPSGEESQTESWLRIQGWDCEFVVRLLMWEDRDNSHTPTCRHARTHTHTHTHTRIHTHKHKHTHNALTSNVSSLTNTSPSSSGTKHTTLAIYLAVLCYTVPYLTHKGLHLPQNWSEVAGCHIGLISYEILFLI
jgi:hypothetical protein